MSATNDTLRTQKIGRYRILKRIGQGMHGVVYLAEDPRLVRQVAIKVLKPEFLAQQGGSPVLPEARALSQLRHPNIVAIYDAGDCGDSSYLVFEYVPGTSLKSRLTQDGPFSETVALSVMTAVADAMAHAHSKGILHLDLTPGNVMIDDQGVPRVMDFGLASLAGFGMASRKGVMGTPRYFTPEHVTTGRFDTRTDVFALGLMFFEMLVGRPVLGGRSLPAIVGTLRGKRYDLSGLTEVAGRKLQIVLGKALAYQPDQRFKSAEPLFAALQRCHETIPVAPIINESSERHSTVDFLLRRMQRQEDFPALSATLVNINQMTADNSKVSTQQLADVVLRDYALASKLLKLANSAFYGLRAEVSSVSRAITVLGFHQVRLTCNSLMLFQHFSKENNPLLLNNLAGSLLAGLLARLLAGRMAQCNSEEAFLAAMFHTLGRSLALYYFADDALAVSDLCRKHGLPEAAAAIQILGISYSDLGQAVAREWSLPENLVQCMSEELPQADVEAAGDDLHLLALTANRIVAAASGEVSEKAQSVIEHELADRGFLGDWDVRDLFTQALDQLYAMTGALDVELARCEIVQELLAWVDGNPTVAARQQAV
jgi:serine/threonine protein kinase